MFCLLSRSRKLINGWTKLLNFTFVSGDHVNMYIVKKVDFPLNRIYFHTKVKKTKPIFFNIWIRMGSISVG